jgi:peptide/nickel transport system permease protein
MSGDVFTDDEALVAPDDGDEPLRVRVRDDPRPALLWLVVGAVLLAVEFGALAGALIELVPWNAVVAYLPAALDPAFAALAGAGESLSSLPTLLSRDVFPNAGHYTPEGVWEGTFLGLSPAVAWFVRVAAVYLYAFAWLAWAWWGYEVFREHYRYADWTPRDDMIDRFRTHRWGQFGLVVVFMFVTMAVFAPTLGPQTLEEGIVDPYSHQFQYYDEETDSVATTNHGIANLDAASQGSPDRNVGPLSYDQYGRFHPFGTMDNGKDLFTFMASGARVSLFIGLVAIGISGVVAAALALLTAYYKGVVDLATVITADSVMALPLLLLLILLSVVLRETWIAQIYSGAFVLALILGGTQWPFLWRAVRGPAFQVSEREWIDAARSYGQKPRVTMRKHMLPYIVGYLFVYTSMTLGGIIIAVAGLSFLGLGINPPTPEWGRAIDAGQQYVTSASWHISLIPGLMIVFVVTAFNAFGDGIRDAIDPQSETGDGEGAEAAAAGGGGA